jgi:LemA protein
MNNFTRCFIAGFAITLLVAVWLISQSAGMFALNTVAKQDWTDLEAQLQRRDDLIPDLVSAVKTYAPDEKGVFTAVAKAQRKLASAATPEAKAEADADLTAALGRLLVLADSHPDLAADGSFFHLRRELDDVEWAIDDAGKNYNEHVDIYNMTIDQFPGSLFADTMGFLPREKFETPTAPAGETESE